MTTPYSTKPLFNITANAFTQLFHRKAMTALWKNRAQFACGHLLDALYKKIKKRSVGHCESNVSYSLSANNAGKLGYGRYYGSKGSLESIERDVRGTLCKDLYYDIDIVNCHPVIIPQFAKRYYNFNMPYLEKYANNRPQFFKLMKEKFNFDEETTKSYIIRILYNGAIKIESQLPSDDEIEVPVEFTLIKDEVTKLCKKIKEDPAHRELLESIRRLDKGNINGTLLSYIAQTEERKCLESMVNWFIHNGYSVDVLAYDGCQIRKEIDKVITDDILQQVQEIIQHDTGYEVLLKDKPFDAINFECEEEDEDVETKNIYKQHKETFEKECFFNKADSRIYWNNNGILRNYSTTDAGTVFNCYYKLPQDRYFINMWLKDPERLSYDYVSEVDTTNAGAYVVPPPLPPSFIYNKYDMEPSPEAWDFFNDFMDVITNHNEIKKEYALNWLAHLLQKPQDLPGVGLILSGDKGCGKDTFGDFIGDWLIGEYFHNFGNQSLFFDKHNTDTLNKYLVKVEELNRKKTLEGTNSDTLKSMITGSITSVNPKGSKAIKSRNFMRFIATTNAINGGVEVNQGERRFVFLVVSGEKIGNHDYWTTLRQTLFCQAGAKAVALGLMARDISNFNPRVLPKDEILQEFQNASKDPVQSFLEQVEAGTYSGNELYDKYIEYCRFNDVAFPYKNTKFGTTATVLIARGSIAGRKVEKRKNNCIQYVVE